MSAWLRACAWCVALVAMMVAALMAVPTPRPLLGALVLHAAHRLGAPVAGYAALVTTPALRRVAHAEVGGMRTGMRYRMASMTKPVTALAVLMARDDGALDLDDAVAMYVPAVDKMRVAKSVDDASHTVEQSPRMTIRHLLTFTSGIGGYNFTWMPNAPAANDVDLRWQIDLYKDLPETASLGDRIDALLVPSRVLYEQPGVKWRYGLSLDVAARVLEVATGKSFGDFVRERLLEPLQMHDTTFLGAALRRDTPPMATVMERKEDTGEYSRVEGGAFVDAVHWTPGGSGLVGTLDDYAKFGALLLRNGSLLAVDGSGGNGKQLVKASTIAEMTTVQFDKMLKIHDGDDGLAGVYWGYGGAVIADSTKMKIPLGFADGDFWWAGVYNTIMVVSKAKQCVVVAGTQLQRMQTLSQMLYYGAVMGFRNA